MSDFGQISLLIGSVMLGVFGGFCLSFVGFYIGKAQAHRDRDEEQAALLAAWPERPEVAK